MSRQIEGGFRNLASYAEEFQGDQEKAARIRAKQEEVHAFLEQEKLLEVNSAWTQLDARRREKAATREVEYYDHLSAVAEEALRVDGDVFVHAGPASVRKALRAKMIEGADPRLRASYTDETLERQVRVAGINVYQWPVYRGGKTTVTLPELISGPTFDVQVPYEGWRQTLRQASQVLPEDTRLIDLHELFIDYANLGKYPYVRDRIKALPGKAQANSGMKNGRG